MLAGPIPFFTDNMVPESVPTYLVSIGHSVTKLRDVMVPDTKDPIIGFACSKTGHVLVTHDKGFRGTAQRLHVSQALYREQLHRIVMRCFEPNDVQRLASCMSLIEAELALITGDRPLFIEIFDGAIKVWR
jgi:hypothetical protein